MSMYIVHAALVPGYCRGLLKHCRNVVFARPTAAMNQELLELPETDNDVHSNGVIGWLGWLFLLFSFAKLPEGTATRFFGLETSSGVHALLSHVDTVS